jgi:hypothetical protein
VTPLAENPRVDAERNVAHLCQLFRIRLWLQIAAPLDELLLADLVAATVRVVEYDTGNASAERARPGEVGGHRLDSIQIEVPGFENVSVTLFLVPFLSADRTLPVRKITQQAVQFAPACIRIAGGPAGRRLKARHWQNRSK